MEKLVTTVRKLEISKLMEFLSENPSKKEVLRNLNKEKNKIKKQLSTLEEPVKNYSNFERLLLSSKYKKYQKEHKEYESKKNELNSTFNDYLNKIKAIESDREYDNNRIKVIDLIPLIEKAKTIEEMALYTFYGTLDIKSNSKYFLAIILLLQNVEIIKNDSDIDKVYKGLNNVIINQKLKEINFDNLIKNLKKIKIDIDDGFYQLMMMIINEESLCSEVNLLSSFPILKQLKEDKGVPKNIRVALEILDNKHNEKRTIHEVSCEIFLKEIFYKIKENRNV